MHVGSNKLLCPDLFIDKWELRKINEDGHGIKNLEDIYVGDYEMEMVDHEKYLGDIIAADGSNDKNIQRRKGKGIGAVNQILTNLENTCYGEFHFQVAVTLRESLLLNGFLTNAEAWYGLTNPNIEVLENVDELLLRKIFEVPSTCPKEMLHLELGCLPIRYVVTTRRLLFLHYILHEEEDSLIHKVLVSQSGTPLKDDWVSTALDDLEDFKISMSFEQIRVMTIWKFQTIVQNAVRTKALEDLTLTKLKHSKVLHIPHTKLQIQEYLKTKKLTNTEKKFAFHARTRMLRVSSNYGLTKNCPVCKDINSRDSQEHLLTCEKLAPVNSLVQNIPKYDDLFGNDMEKFVIVLRNLQENFRKRKNLLEKEDTKK